MDLGRTADILDDPDLVEEKRRTTEQVVKDCGEPLFHYTDPVAANAIYAGRTLIASPPDPPYPAGAFATTITPLNPGWTQVELSDHLFQDPEKPSDAWVLFCSRHNPAFRRIPPPTNEDKPDYRYIPAASGTQVPVVPEARGVNPMDYE